MQRQQVEQVVSYAVTADVSSSATASSAIASATRHVEESQVTTTLRNDCGSHRSISRCGNSFVSSGGTCGDSNGLITAEHLRRTNFQPPTPRSEAWMDACDHVRNQTVPQPCSSTDATLGYLIETCDHESHETVKVRSKA